MNEALRQKFHERLLAVAAARYRKALAALAAGDPETVRAETHALAGEAFMLGETDLGNLASAAEEASVAWSARTSESAATARALEAVGVHLNQNLDG